MHLKNDLIDLLLALLNDLIHSVKRLLIRNKIAQTYTKAAHNKVCLNGALYRVQEVDCSRRTKVIVRGVNNAYTCAVQHVIIHNALRNHTIADLDHIVLARIIIILLVLEISVESR